MGITPMRGGGWITEADLASLKRDGIDNEALGILYHSTHDAVQKLLIAEIAVMRNIHLTPENIAA